MYRLADLDVEQDHDVGEVGAEADPALRQQLVGRQRMQRKQLPAEAAQVGLATEFARPGDCGGMGVRADLCDPPGRRG